MLKHHAPQRPHTHTHTPAAVKHVDVQGECFVGERVLGEEVAFWGAVSVKGESVRGVGGAVWGTLRRE